MKQVKYEKRQQLLSKYKKNVTIFVIMKKKIKYKNRRQQFLSKYEENIKYEIILNMNKSMSLFSFKCETN